MKLKLATVLLLGLIAGFFIRAQQPADKAPGTYQLACGPLISTNHARDTTALVMLDTRNGTLYYFQSLQVGNGVQGQWVRCEAMQQQTGNQPPIRYTPGR